MPSFIAIIDILGAIAFAVSGALVGIRKEMDLFGVNILAVITAAGGGLIRDIIMGNVPPALFVTPRYVILAAIAANITFFFVYRARKSDSHVAGTFQRIYDLAMFWFDTLGLASFTADGFYAGFISGYRANMFLVVFLAVTTGIGGGILRDLLATEKPYVFVKHIYACASIAGALTMDIVVRLSGKIDLALILGIIVTIVIRVLASHFRWNLPRIKGTEM